MKRYISTSMGLTFINPCRQYWHVCGLFAKCLLMCLTSVAFRLNPQPHILQTCRLCPSICLERSRRLFTNNNAQHTLVGFQLLFMTNYMPRQSYITAKAFITYRTVMGGRVRCTLRQFDIM